jgi:hypothetical protein
MIATLTPLRSLHISVLTDPVLLSSLRYSAIECILCHVASLLNPGHARLALTNLFKCTCVMQSPDRHWDGRGLWVKL